MTTRRLEEQFAFSGGKVDRTGARPHVREVLLCGATSANRRRYLAKAFAGERVKRYEGKRVYFDHGDRRTGRRYRDHIGWVRNPRHNAAGLPIGDIEVKPKHPLTEQFLDDAEHDPKAVGMSHVAHCKTTRAADGWEEVDEVVEVESVDVVTDPATTTSLFENRNRTMPLTVKALCEALVKHPKTSAKQATPLKLLSEMEGMDAAPTSYDAPPADDAEPVDGVKEAFKSAVLHIVDKALGGEMDPKDALSKIKTLLKSHGEVNGKEVPDEETKKPEEESVKNKPTPADPIAVFSECRKLDYEPTPSELKYLCTLPAAERTAHVTEAKARVAKVDPPKGTSRRPMAGTAGNTPPQPVVVESKGKIPDWDSWK